MKHPAPQRLAGWLLILGAFLVMSPGSGFAQAQEPKPATTIEELRQQLSALVSQPKYAAALWGVKVVSLDTGATLFEHNPQKLFSPASNSKLYTVALALDRLGADFRIRTSLYAAARPNNSGVLKGDLVLYGRGDPTLNARLHGGKLANALDPLAGALTNAGVKKIAGDLVADESYFRGPEYGSGWTWDDLEYYYGAEISALTINDNVLQASVRPGDRPGVPGLVDLAPATPLLWISNRTQTAGQEAAGGIRFYRPLERNVLCVSGEAPLGHAAYAEDITLPNPAAFFADWFREAFVRHGIKLGGRVRTVNWLDRQAAPLNPATLTELGAVESPALSEIAREVQKPSQNLYTDLLLAQVGERTRSRDTRPEETSEDLGIRELRKFLPEAGIGRDEVFFEEGSGLSRNNLTTPNATVKLLQHMSRHAAAQVYLDSLPIAGVDGTLRNRMKNTPAANNVRAKTGTLRWANSLSGYVKTAAGERLAFSLMLNRYYAGPGASARGDLDAIAVMLASFPGHTQAPPK